MRGKKSYKGSKVIRLHSKHGTQRALQQRLNLKFHRIRVKGMRADYVLHGLLQGSISMNGFRFCPLQGVFRCCITWMTQIHKFPCSFHTKQKTPLCLTFFFGRCTSSFIEAHLFKVLSRLKERQKKAMGWNYSKQRTHQNRALQI